jgi:hypothetical protein
MKHGVVILTLGLMFSACDAPTSTPTGPGASGPGTPVTGPTPSGPLTVSGYVSDTAFRPMVGVNVEVTQGPDAGKVMTSDAAGRFTYEGIVTTNVTLRATKDGYAVAIEPVRILTTGGAWVSFLMASLSTPVPVEGNYTLTIGADPACTRLPDDVRTRTYSVSVTPNLNSRSPANTTFNGRLTEGRFAPYANIFWVGVSGDYVTVSTEGEGPSIVEQVGENRYIAFTGSAGVTVSTREVSTLSAAYRGVIEYCQLTGPIGEYYECRSPEVREQCSLSGSVLTLTRR